MYKIITIKLINNHLINKLKNIHCIYTKCNLTLNHRIHKNNLWNQHTKSQVEKNTHFWNWTFDSKPNSCWDTGHKATSPIFMFLQMYSSCSNQHYDQSQNDTVGCRQGLRRAVWSLFMRVATIDYVCEWVFVHVTTSDDNEKYLPLSKLVLAAPQTD